MKKIGLFLIGTIFVLGLNAQIRNIDTGYDKVVSNGNSAYFITGGSSDTTGTGDSTISKTVFINSNDELICDIYVDSDSTGGTSSVANAHYFIIRWKEFPDDGYTNGDTVTYAGTADTTFTLSSTTARKARYFQLLEKGKTDELKTELQKAYFKFWK